MKNTYHIICGFILMLCLSSRSSAHPSEQEMSAWRLRMEQRKKIEDQQEARGKKWLEEKEAKERKQRLETSVPAKSDTEFGDWNHKPSKEILAH